LGHCHRLETEGDDIQGIGCTSEAILGPLRTKNTWREENRHIAMRGAFDVRFGSKADVRASNRNVRFTLPKADMDQSASNVR
jgi:hypothetical protein